MEELYFPHAEALNLSNSFSHLKGTSFEKSNNMQYGILTIMPVPASSEEQTELRDLIAEYIESKGANQSQMDAFESRQREDKFTVMLFATCVLSGGANLLSVSVSQFVAEDGVLKYGFPVHRNRHLF